MNKIAQLSFGLLLFLLACQHNDKKKNIIPPEKMTRILTDVLLAKEMYIQKKPEFDKDSIQPVESILKSYGTDSLQFQQALTYYANRPETFKKIYDQVIQNLERKLDSIDATTKNKKTNKNKKNNPKKNTSTGIPKLNNIFNQKK